MICSFIRNEGAFILFSQGTEGIQNATNFAINNDSAVTVTPSKGNQDHLSCCVTGNCSFQDALTNVTNDVVIDVKTSTVLSAIISIENVDNILIRSQTNATISCADSALLRFVSTSNITIEGINWQGCEELQFYNSSNVTVRDCNFHNSTKQALVMLESSGDVYIKDCYFTQSNSFGQGSAIHYSSETVTNPPLSLIINNCSFTSNGPTGSVVYVSSPTRNTRPNLFVQDSVFVNNLGVPIFLSSVELHFLGSVLFRQNTAYSGGGIFSINSIVHFDNCSVEFYSNSSPENGGAVFLHYSNMIFGSDSAVRFENNSASIHGGAIFSQSESVMTFFGNSEITFSSNSAGDGGGAIGAYSSSDVNFDYNTIVTFRNNVARSSGGAIDIVSSSDMLFTGNSRVDFTNNSAQYGSAIHSSSSSDTFIYGRSVVTFCNNGHASQGGAMSLDDNCNLFVDEYSSVTFVNNTGTNGGAIYSYLRSDISFQGNAVVKFINNAATDGGVLCKYHYPNYYDYLRPIISFLDKSTVTFRDNYAINYGGVVYINHYVAVSFDDQSVVTFIRNRASYGGAVYAYQKIQMIFDGSAKVTFVNNTATTQGGAVYFGYSNSIIFNASVLFQNNSATSGLAVYCTSSSSNLRYKESLYKASIHYNSDDGKQLSDTCAVSVEKYACEYIQ